jgi:glycosyltransferase involved in cell wall biosynthesis
MKIFEYMAMAIPAVTPRMPNIGGIVNDGYDGLPSTPESIDSLSAALRGLAEDDKLRRSHGESTRQWVETDLNWEHDARRVVTIADGLICSDSSGG